MDEIVETFEGLAQDLMKACAAAGGRNDRVPIQDAVGAVAGRLGQTVDEFAWIENVLRMHYKMGPRRKYINF